MSASNRMTTQRQTGADTAFSCSSDGCAPGTFTLTIANLERRILSTVAFQSLLDSSIPRQYSISGLTRKINEHLASSNAGTGQGSSLMIDLDFPCATRLGEPPIPYGHSVLDAGLYDRQSPARQEGIRRVMDGLIQGLDTAPITEEMIQAYAESEPALAKMIAIMPTLKTMDDATWVNSTEDEKASTVACLVTVSLLLESVDGNDSGRNPMSLSAERAAAMRNELQQVLDNMAMIPGVQDRLDRGLPGARAHLAAQTRPASASGIFRSWFGF